MRSIPSENIYVIVLQEKSCLQHKYIGPRLAVPVFSKSPGDALWLFTFLFSHFAGFWEITSVICIIVVERWLNAHSTYSLSVLLFLCFNYPRQSLLQKVFFLLPLQSNRVLIGCNFTRLWSLGFKSCYILVSFVDFFSFLISSCKEYKNVVVLVQISYL